MTKIRVSVVAVVMAVAMVGGQSAAFAGSSPDNIVEVRNTTDGALMAQSRAVITHAPGGTVENNNVATAWATCANCRTAAAAVQMLIVEGPYTTFEPGNLAAAINDGCDTCETFAYARQYVFVVGHEVRISGWSEHRLEDINEEMADVVQSRDAFPTMEAELDSLTQQLVDVVRHDIARAGKKGGEQDQRDVQEH
jgi:putative peptide zinc metalloprotease protein